MRSAAALTTVAALGGGRRAEAARRSRAPWGAGAIAAQNLQVVPRYGRDAEWPEAVILLSLHPERVVDDLPSSRAIVVQPSRVFMRRGKRLRWLVNAVAGDLVRIEFKADHVKVRPRAAEAHYREAAPGGRAMVGPFLPPTGRPQTRDMGVYEIEGPGEIDSGPSLRSGAYSYNVIWERPGAGTFELDPMIFIFDRAFTRDNQELAWSR